MTESIKYQFREIRLFEAIIALLGICAFGYSVYEAANGLFNPEWLVLAFVTVFLVSRIDLKLLKTPTGISLTESFIFIAMLLYGTPLAVILAALDSAVSLLQNKDQHKTVALRISTAILSTCLAGGIVEMIASYLPTYTTNWGYLAFLVALLALIHFIVNSLLVSAALAIRLHHRFMHVWRESLLWTGLSYFVSAAVACLMLKLIQTVSFFAFIISVPILAITYLTYKVYLDKVEASNRHAE